MRHGATEHPIWAAEAGLSDSNPGSAPNRPSFTLALDPINLSIADPVPGLWHHGNCSPTRLESLVEVVKGLSGENARLKAELASAREASDKNVGAAAALQKHEADRAAVRARIEGLLKTLEESNPASRPV